MFIYLLLLHLISVWTNLKIVFWDQGWSIKIEVLIISLMAHIKNHV